ncbi:protein FAR1-RELATED SEQUENCE 5-like [Silene latifolia]|uniref:protein FAR1-RELATED SEQUENCE 5-like n=1 Tax=Silene latifolia TaxID=37657 RepID=UPI003D773764
MTDGGTNMQKLNSKFITLRRELLLCILVLYSFPDLVTAFTSKPQLGQIFEKLEDAISFYNVYAEACGFEPRKTSKKNADGAIFYKLVVCNREGFRDGKKRKTIVHDSVVEQTLIKPFDIKNNKLTRIGCDAMIEFRLIKDVYVVAQFREWHNHRLCSLTNQEFQRKKRHLHLFHKKAIIDHTKVNLGPTSAYRYSKEHADGYENVGAQLIDFKNFGRDIKCFIGDKDAQLFINHFEDLRETNPGFYFAYEVDSFKFLFGTLEPSEFECKWFELIVEHNLQANSWLSYMYKKRRRWIPAYYRDIPMGCLLRTTQRSESQNSFFKHFENVHGTLVEFWMRFQSAMDQQRHTQKQHDRDSDYTLPQLATSLNFEAHASKVYTHAIFKDFKQEGAASMCSLSVGGFTPPVDSIEVIVVTDARMHKTYQVVFNSTSTDAECSCKLFNRKGIICRHIIWVFSGKQVRTLPDKYILMRWTKNAQKIPLYGSHGELLDNFDATDVRKLEMYKLWSEFYSTISLLRIIPNNQITYLADKLKQFWVKLNP